MGQFVTDLAQVRRLLAVGVERASADMYQEKNEVLPLPAGVDFVSYELVMMQSWRMVEPMWSLEALLQVLEKRLRLLSVDCNCVINWPHVCIVMAEYEEEQGDMAWMSENGWENVIRAIEWVYGVEMENK